MSRPRTVVVNLLSGGVSTQPPHRRFVDQVQAAENVSFSLIDGASKRHGTRYIKRITGLTSGRDYRLHAIRRDDSEKYLVVSWASGGSAQLFVYDTSGNSATINDTQSLVSGYLASASATSGDLRFTTSADTTLITNRNVIPLAATSANYTVTAEVRDYDVLLSFANPLVTSGQYVHTRDDTAIQPAGYFQYQIAYNFAQHVCTEVTGTQWASHNATNGYQSAGNNPGGFVVDFKKQNAGAGTASSWDGTTQIVTKTGAFLTYTYEVGDKLYVTAGVGWSAGTYYTIVNKLDDSRLTLSGGPAGTNVPTWTHVGAKFEVTVDFTVAAVSDMYDVAAEFQRALRRAGATRACINWTRAYNAANPKGKFTILSPWGGTEATVVGLAAPTITGFDYRAAGTPFEPGTATAGTGSTMGVSAEPVDRWLRVAAPNQASADPTDTTLPIRLRRTSTSPLTFDLSTAPWENRTSGDPDTNPTPSVFDGTFGISDVGFLDNRLFMLSGEHVVASQAGDFYNLFKLDADNLIDSDPIDINAGVRAVTIGDFLTPVPHLQTLLVTTRGPVQLLVSGGDAGYTPDQTSISLSTSKQTITGVRPALMDTAIYFVTTAGNAADLYEYRGGDRLVPTDAPLVSEHVTGYIPSSVQTIAACDNLGIVAMLAGNAIYFYRTRFVNGQKALAAFYRATFDASITIRDIAIIDTDVYLLTLRGSSHFIEKLPLGQVSEGDSFPWVVHLDSTFSFNSGTFSAGNTTWTLPDSTSDTTINSLVAEDGKCYTVTCNGTTVTLAGVNLSTTKVRIGRSFPMSLTLSRPYPQGQGGAEQLNALWIWKSLTVAHFNSGEYTITRTGTESQTGAETVNTTANATAPTITTGTARLRLGGSAETQTVTITSTNAHPVTISGLEHNLEVSPDGDTD